MKTRSLAYIAMFTALIAAGAFIRIPIPVVPFTLQFLFTTLAGLLLGAKRGVLSVLCYIVLGLIGLPIFTSGGGIFYVVEPTFGYIIGFAAGAFVTGLIAWRKNPPSFVRLLVACFAGLAIVYLLGIVYYYFICRFYLNSAIGVKALLLYCFVLAVPGDIFLCFVASLVAKRLYVMLKRMEEKKNTTVERCKKKILAGESITRAEAEELSGAELQALCRAADEIRKKMCGNGFDLCSIVNAKSGKCGEDCKFCAQSVRYRTDVTEYPLLQKEEMLKHARHSAACGAVRFSAVTSGGKLSDGEVDDLCDALRAVQRETDIALCASVGLVGEENFAKLKDAGVRRVHCNLETSRNFFPNICTTHTYEDKLAVLEAARRAGMSVCSGGIMGLGESMRDRLDMAFELKELGVKSVPINFLQPIGGTPLENMPPLSDDEKRRIVAVFRFILPDASIRLAGGRMRIGDRGRACFLSGANAAITGDMLTTAGVTAEEDLAMLREIGYEVRLCEK